MYKSNAVLINSMNLVSISSMKDTSVLLILSIISSSSLANLFINSFSKIKLKIKFALRPYVTLYKHTFNKN